jgi:hypothetical protein
MSLSMPAWRQLARLAAGFRRWQQASPLLAKLLWEEQRANSDFSMLRCTADAAVKNSLRIRDIARCPYA